MKNSAGGAINASIIEEEKSRSGADTLSTILHLERRIQILQREGRGIQSPAAMWERRRCECPRLLAEDNWQGLALVTARFYGWLRWQPHRFSSDCSQTEVLTALFP